MGRPKKRRRASDAGPPSSELITQVPVESLSSDTSHTRASPLNLVGSLDWDPTISNLAYTSPNDQVVLGPPMSHASTESEPTWEAPPLVLPLGGDVPAATAVQQCACLSAMYLTLDNLRVMEDFTFPPSLHLLRRATATGWDVVQCEHCPERFLTAMQNVQLLGLLLISLAERYGKVIRAIDVEEQRLTLAKETKSFRVGDTSPATMHMHNGELDCPASFMIELQPLEWRAMAKKVVKTEIHGKESENSPALGNLIKRLEERQKAWHVSHPVKDVPELCYDRIPDPQDKPLCLTLAREAKRMVELMNFD